MDLEVWKFEMARNGHGSASYTTSRAKPHDAQHVFSRAPGFSPRTSRWSHLTTCIAPNGSIPFVLCLSQWSSSVQLYLSPKPHPRTLLTLTSHSTPIVSSAEMALPEGPSLEPHPHPAGDGSWWVVAGTGVRVSSLFQKTHPERSLWKGPAGEVVTGSWWWEAPKLSRTHADEPRREVETVHMQKHGSHL